MRYILIFLIVVITGCSGQTNNSQHSKIDTSKLFNPNNYPDHSGANEIQMFKRSVVLIKPNFYAVLNDNEYKFENRKELSDFIKTNKDEIKKDLFYIITDSNTVFKKITSTIEALKENDITDYKVINVQQYFAPPEPVTIQAPISIVSTFDENDSTLLSISIHKDSINVKLNGNESRLKSINDLDLFFIEHKTKIKEIIVTTEKGLPDSKFKAVLEVLKKHEYKSFRLVTK